MKFLKTLILLGSSYFLLKKISNARKSIDTTEPVVPDEPTTDETTDEPTDETIINSEVTSEITGLKRDSRGRFCKK